MTTLVIPAAGAGTRLVSPLPKVLAPVAGRPMLSHLLDLYLGAVDRAVVVVAPAALEAVRRVAVPSGLDVLVTVQVSPTGMLDAILVPLADVAVDQPDWVWVTWCDQVAVHPGTVARLARECANAAAGAGLIVPTVTRPDPYIHLVRDSAGRVAHVLHRREGDPMPAVGESDIGVFALSGSTYLEWLPSFASEPVRGAATGERNFLPFIPWLDARVPGAVRTFPGEDEIESVGINTPDDLRRIEAYLAIRDRPDAKDPS